MAYLLAFLWALPSGFIWFFNAEAFVVVQVTKYDAVPWAVAICVVVGQFIGYTVLYFFANRFLARFQRVRNAVAKVPIEAPGWRSYAMFMTGGLLGLPPLMALFALYGAKRIGRFRGYLLAAMPARFLWYLGWAYSPELLQSGFGWLRSS